MNCVQWYVNRLFVSQLASNKNYQPYKILEREINMKILEGYEKEYKDWEVPKVVRKYIGEVKNDRV